MTVTLDQLWTFPVDRGLRRRLFAPEVFSHPAKLHLGLLQKLIDLYTYPGETLLDPMAGTGSLMIAATQQRRRKEQGLPIVDVEDVLIFRKAQP